MLIYFFKKKCLLFTAIQKSHYRVLDREIEFSLKKAEFGFWPRLTRSPQKPAWLKVDFDKWKVNDPDIDDDNNRNVLDDYPELYDKLQKEEKGYKIGSTAIQKKTIPMF